MQFNVNGAVKDRAILVQEAEGLVAKAQREGRNLTCGELEIFGPKMADVTVLDRQFEGRG